LFQPVHDEQKTSDAESQNNNNKNIAPGFCTKSAFINLLCECSEYMLPAYIYLVYNCSYRIRQFFIDRITVKRSGW